MRPPSRLLAILLLTLAAYAVPVAAHHVLGRPAYSLNEDSNTPPSMEVETQVGAYFVTFMAYPAFPRANEPGRVHLYASRISDSKPYQGEVIFKARDDRWFGGDEEFLGRQPPDDNVFRQGFVFREEGDYIVTAFFEADGEPYAIDFPLRIGDPAPVGPIGVAVGVIMVVLVGVSLIQRRRLTRSRVHQHHAELRERD